MTVLITADGEYLAEQGKPEVGKRYILEDALTGTGAQNRAFHALAQEYWKSGAHSYSAKSFEEFREQLKLYLGEGVETYVYATPDGIKKACVLEDVPKEYRTPKFCMIKVKHWSDYTLKQRRETIDRLIAEMHQAGVQTKKFYEILEGMDGKNRIDTE